MEKKVTYIDVSKISYKKAKNIIEVFTILSRDKISAPCLINALASNK